MCVAILLATKVQASRSSDDDRSVRLGRAIAWGLAGLGLVVLAGWALDIDVLKAPVPGTRPMVPNTAAMFVLVALALGLQASPDGARRRRRIGRAAAALTVAAAAAFLAEYALGLELGIEQVITSADPALPAPETSTAFVLLGLALLFLDVRPRRGPALAEVLALGGAALPLLVAIGHLYGYVYFEAKLPIGMAVHTSIGLLALGVGVLAVRPRRGLASIVASEHSGGAVSRRLLLVAAIAIPTTGLISVGLQHAGVFPPPGASVLGATLSLVVILAALLISGAQLGRVEAELRHWNRFVDAAPFGAVFGTPDGKLLRMNEAFARMHGWTREELVGRPIVELFSAAERPQVASLLATIERLGRYRFESEHVRKDGSVFPVVVDAAAVRDSRGKLLYRVAYVQDISEERRARADQARLASLVESADDAIIASDVRGVITSWNRGAERLYGYSAEEMIGRTGEALVAAERASERRVLVGRLDRGEVIAGFETERIRKDGTAVPVSLTLSPIRGLDGITGYVGIAHDITARLAAERALDELSDELSRIERATLSVADAIAELPTIGLTRVLEVIAAEARGLTGATCAAVAVTGRPGDPPRPCVSAGDTATPITDVLGVPVKFHGETRGHLFVASKRGGGAFEPRDRRILEHLATHLGSAIEIALLYEREAIERARLDATVNQIPEGVIVLDATGQPIRENQAALAFRDVEGAPQLYDVRWPSGQAIPVADLPLSRAFTHGETTTGVEMKIKLPDGEMVPAIASASPIRVGETQVGAVAVFRDIRTLKALEQMREEWTSVVAHDLRQPINAIRLAADLLARSSPDGAVITWSRRIVGEVLRLDTMIDDLLDASKLEARRLTLRREPVRPVAMVEAALSRAPDLASRCELQVEPGLPPVLADPARVLQVLGNLLSNAVKYGDPTAPVAVTAAREGDDVRFTVANRGAGIPADEMATLFGRFTRTRASRNSRIEGTGLGLYICKGLVEAHGGRIWVESTPGETTRFHLTLPIVEAAPAAAPEPAEAHASA